jgi:hypothetical protein
LKAIIKDGFKGELQEELEKYAVKKKRFKVFDLGDQLVIENHLRSYRKRKMSQR